MGGVDPLDTLPWSTDLCFQVQRYGIGHKTLTLRHGWKLGEPGYKIRFEGVSRLELDLRTWHGLTLTPLCAHGRYDQNWWQPLLLLELRDGRADLGFVACNRVGWDELQIGAAGEVVKRLGHSGIAAPYSELAVGGVPVSGQPHDIPGQLWTGRRPTPEEREAGVYH